MMRWLHGVEPLPASRVATIRDIDFEREWTTQAAASLGVDASRLVAFAERRAAVSAAIDGMPARDFGAESLEEAADWRNYLVFWLQQIQAAPEYSELDGDITAAIGQAIAHVAAGFEHVEQARALWAERRAETSR